MTERFDPDSGVVLLTDEELAVLPGFEGRSRAADLYPLRDLIEAGAFDRSGSPHDALRPAIDATVRPVCRLELRRNERRGRGWVSTTTASFLTPAATGWQLAHVPTTFLPEALARMNDVRPRPHASPTSVHVSASDLERIVAGEAAVVGEDAIVKTSWKVEVTWDPAADAPGRRALHVLDSTDASWIVAEADGGFALRTVTSTEIFRRLTLLLPHDEELAAEPARQ